MSDITSGKRKLLASSTSGARGNVAGYEIFAAPNACSYCQQFDGTRFAIDVAPIIPHEACRRDSGCRCILSPILALDWDPAERNPTTAMVDPLAATRSGITGSTGRTNRIASM
jgi:hypothetical protein